MRKLSTFLQRIAQLGYSCILQMERNVCVIKRTIRGSKWRREKKISFDCFAGNCLYSVDSLHLDGWGVFLPFAKWNVVRLRVRNGFVCCLRTKTIRIRTATTRSIPHLVRGVNTWSHLHRYQGLPFHTLHPARIFLPVPLKTRKLFRM